MASVVYTPFKARVMAGEFDLESADIRAALLQTTTSADSDVDAAALDEITTLGECSVASYARQALANEAVNTDTGNDRGEFDADDVDFGSLESGQTIKGALIYEHIDGNPANDKPICFIDFDDDLVLDGNAVSIQWNAEGILQLA